MLRHIHEHFAASSHISRFHHEAFAWLDRRAALWVQDGFPVGTHTTRAASFICTGNFDSHLFELRGKCFHFWGAIWAGQCVQKLHDFFV